MNKIDKYSKILFHIIFNNKKIILNIYYRFSYY